jgi:hypothetical protein
LLQIKGISLLNVLTLVFVTEQAVCANASQVTKDILVKEVSIYF